MESISRAILSAWESLKTAAITNTWWSTWEALGEGWHSLIDIGVMTFLVYQAYIRFRGTRAMRVLIGAAILGLSGLIAQRAGLFLTSWLLSGIGAATLLFVLIIFQAEIRQILEQINPERSARRLLRKASHLGGLEGKMHTVAEAVFMLASKRCGALIVFERRDFLEPILSSPGKVIDAVPSQELLENLFTPPTPLHDGALYIREGRIYRAGCVLPLSDNQRLASFYGTRHRAALGISEHSDALAVVVSEERGTVSVAEKGTLEVVKTAADLGTWLTERLSAPGEEPKRRWLNPSVVTSNWRPKLASVGAVCLLWLVLVGRQDTEVGFSVPVVYTNVPQNLTIQDRQAQEVYVRVRGSEELLNFLNLDRLRVAVDLKEARVGSQRYRLFPKDVNLPPGLQLLEIEPSEIRLRLQQKPSENGGKPQ